MSEEGLGDLISHALSAIGVTPERVSRFIGRPCGCAERRDRMNALTFWAKRVLVGKALRAREYLERIIES